MLTLLQAANEAATTAPPDAPADGGTFTLPDVSGLPPVVQWVVLALAAGVTAYFGWKGIKWAVKVAKPKPPAALLALAAMLALGGCAGGPQKAAIRHAVATLEPVVHDLENRANATPTERAANQRQLNAIGDAAK